MAYLRMLLIYKAFHSVIAKIVNCVMLCRYWIIIRGQTVFRRLFLVSILPNISNPKF